MRIDFSPCEQLEHSEPKRMPTELLTQTNAPNMMTKVKHKLLPNIAVELAVHEIDGNQHDVTLQINRVIDETKNGWKFR